MVIAGCRLIKRTKKTGDYVQTTDFQKDALLSRGILGENIHEDRVRGKLKERVGLNELLSKLQSGDSVIVWKLDRLGRLTINL